MTHQLNSHEGNGPLLKDGSFWLQVVLPLILAVGAGLGLGKLADNAEKDLQRAMAERDSTITSPADQELPSSFEIR